MPIELLIKKYYKSKSIKKLKTINPFIITITGSYGKTTLKDILYEIYSRTYLTVKTPNSYNTPMGISKTILNDLSPLTEIFITEAGATKCGDIKEITTMLNPNIGIITNVGPQHLKTFKSINNILKTKWELANYMPINSKLILNYQNQYLNGLTANDLKETIPVNTNASYYYQNVCYNQDITEFDIYKNNKKLLHLKTKMKGLHNIENITLAYACVKTLEQYGYYINNNTFKDIIYNLKNTPHRLSEKTEQINNVTFRYLDDSYNSNLNGFKSAINTLNSLDGIKVLITPGLVDTGMYTKELYLELYPYLNNLDDLILINNKSILELIKILKEKQINYLIFKSLEEAINHIKNKYIEFNDTTINILLENDLPDNYLMR